MRLRTPILFIFLIQPFLAGCQPVWSVEISSSLGSLNFSKQEFDVLLERFPENEYCKDLLLEQVLYESGIEVIDSLQIITMNGEAHEYFWENAAELFCIQKNGELTTEKGTLKPAQISVKESELDLKHIHITNIPSTALSALGLLTDEMQREILIDGKFEHVVMIFLDGFGFEKFQYAEEKGLIDFQLDADRVYQAVSVYPPRTITGSAAVLTGLFPKDNGVDKTGIRKTEATTIFDITKENGITSAAIEGESLSFYLRNTEVVLSGDRDLSGGTDDNVFNNAMDVIIQSMPKLLWIHFHGIDDFGHTYGPDAPILDEKISEINDYLAQIYAALPEDTLIFYFADHGMHAVNEEGRLGNHGHLIYKDMVIPVTIKTK